MLVIYALIMPVVLLFCGLTLDIGVLELTKLRMQTAADAGALAAELEAERGTGNWVTMAQQDAALNGFTDGSNNVSVSVFQQPDYGDYYNRYGELEVSISQNLPTVFMWTLNGGTVNVTAKSVVQMTPCVYLYGGGAGGLTPYGLDNFTGSFNGNTCPMYAQNGIDIETNGHTAVNAWNIAGSSSSSILAGYYFPGPFFNATAISDPLAWETQPTVPSTCDHTSFSYTGPGTTTINPGYYCNGLNLTGSGTTFVYFNPGLYIISGGANWSGVHVIGNGGVTLFFTKGTASSYGQFIMGLETSVTLSAPTDNSAGGIPGILVFADRNWVHTGSQDFQFSSSAYGGDGIWYILKAGLYFNNCATFTGSNYLGIVADNMYIANCIVVPVNNYSVLSGGNPFLNSGQPIGGLVQ